MFVSFVPYLVIGILLVLLMIQAVSLRMARKLVSRLLIDEIYYCESRSNLFLKNIDNPAQEQRLQGNLHRVLDDKKMQMEAWLVAVNTDKKSQVPHRSARLYRTRNLSLT